MAAGVLSRGHRVRRPTGDGRCLFCFWQSQCRNGHPILSAWIFADAISCDSTRLKTGAVKMRYKVKWRGGGDEPLTPETFDSEAAAKERARDLLAKYGSEATVEIWNDDE